MRNRHRATKPDERKQARIYVGRGYPIAFVAERLEVSRTTVYAWTEDLAADVRTLANIRRQFARLPQAQKRALLRDFVKQAA